MLWVWYKGHRKSECPEKVARVIEKGSPKSKILKGTIGKTPCELTLDTGADCTVVREDLVSHHEYTGKTSTVGDYFGYWRNVPTAQGLKGNINSASNPQRLCLSGNVLYCKSLFIGLGFNLASLVIGLLPLK